MKKKKIDEDFEIEIDEDDDSSDEGKSVICHICGRKIISDIESYAYTAINMTSLLERVYRIDERFFCSKKCFEEYILREAEQIRFEQKSTTNKITPLSKKSYIG